MFFSVNILAETVFNIQTYDSGQFERNCYELVYQFYLCVPLFPKS